MASAVADLAMGDDGLPRCRWGATSPEYLAYHDLEWGRPVADEGRIYEKVCLEGFQSGLSWLTILRKREQFRAAFAGFDPVAVAEFADADVDRLLGDAGIVRHRAKIVATITNARAVFDLHRAGRSLAEMVWASAPPDGAAPVKLDDIASSTPESKALSSRLRAAGFRFVGPTTVYSAMQSLGVVDDHLRGCFVRAEVEEQRRRFTAPVGGAESPM